MKYIVAVYLALLCLASCRAEEISWCFDKEPVKATFSPTCKCLEGLRCICGQECVCTINAQASGPEWFIMGNGHLYHQKTGWYWNPHSRSFYHQDYIQPQPTQMNFAPMPFGGVGNDCPQRT